MTDVCVIGQGHIGLPTALTIAANGFQVTGVDTNEQLVSDLNAGKNVFIEPGLTELLQATLASKTYKASSTPAQADVFIVSVPTPLDSSNAPVLDFVIAAAESIAPHITAGAIVVLESTVPPGTTEGIFKTTLLKHSELKPDIDYHIAHCPERVLPGTILRELVENDRVIGGATADASSKTAAFYETFVSGEVFETDSVTAELVKLSENIYRDVNIGFANELANISEELGADVWDVIKVANQHPRVNIHQPGPGVGGYCIPVAPWMLSANVKQSPKTVLTARGINAGQPSKIATRVIDLLADTPNPTVAVLGTAYKGGVGDARATPSLEVIERLNQSGINVKVHDPFTTAFPYPIESLESALEQSDLAIILTDHSDFRSIDPSRAASLMKTHIVVDTRNMLTTREWEQAGFTVVKLGVGR
jgi:UDP-N-acetyl-D-mannosaminuronic acid dehydrogenase